MKTVLAILICLLCAGPATAGTVRLRHSAVVPADRAIVLSDVADLEGADAEALGEEVLIESPALRAGGRGWVEVGIDDVRRALGSAKARSARVAVSGSVCTVRLTARAAPTSHAPRPDGPSGPPPMESIDPDQDGTIGGAVVRVLLGMFGVEPSRLRVRFDERDLELVSRPVHAERVSVVPMSTVGSRVTVGVRVFLGGQLIEQRTVVVETELYRRVVIIREDLPRKREISPELLSEMEMWVTPSGSPPVASAGSAAGSLARARLQAGSILRESDIEPAIAIRRGELAVVHCLRGGVVLQTRARARQDGRIGDRIEFRVDGSKRSFTARVDARGVAVTDLDDPARDPVSSLQEEQS